MKKAGLFILVISVLVSSGYASSIGTFSSETEKTVDSRDAKFSISVFNLGEKPVELEIDSTEFEDATVVHPESMRIAPSTATRNPESGDASWFLLEDGRYVETTEIPVEIIIDSERDRNRFDFTVSLEGSQESSQNTGERAVQNIAQVRSYSYSVKTTSPMVNKPGDNSVETSQEVKQSGGFVEEVSKSIGKGVGGLQDIGSSNQEDTVENVGDGENPEKSDKEKSDPGSVLESSESEDVSGRSGKSAPNSPTGEFLQSIGFNSVTVILMMMMTVSTVYLVKVI